MKKHHTWLPPIILCAFLVWLSLTVAACRSAFLTPSSPTSLPSLTGAAGTNDSEVIAWLKFAQQVNSTANITPTNQPIDRAITALEVLASAAAGWFARHAQGKPPAST